MNATTLSSIGREAARIVLCSGCIVCGAELPWLRRRGSCCIDCWERLPRLDKGRCSRCAIPWEGPSRNDDFLCIPCQDREDHLGWIDAWGRYSGGLDQVVQALKFSRHHFLASALSELLLEAWRKRDDLSFDVAVPVPMHRIKLRKRGFNQAELLATAFARRAGLRCEPGMLGKFGERAAQASLPKEDRGANVRGIFRAAEGCGSKSILLVDDICTTGETLRACAAELMGAGARRVCALVVARA